MTPEEMKAKVEEFMKQRELYIKEINEHAQKMKIAETNLIRLEGVIGFLNEELNKVLET